MDGEASASSRTLVSKLEFARIMQRAPSAVSNWIAAGKLTPAAIIGEGNRAKIWVERAKLDLARNLDPAQQNMQAVPIAVTQAIAPAATAPAAPSAPVASDPIVDDIARRRRADAEAAELAVEEKRRRLNQDSGVWVSAAEVRAAYAAELAKIVSDLDTFILQTLCVEVADEFGLDVKLVTIFVRELFRSYRGGVADDAQAAIEESDQVLSEAAE